MSELTLGEAQSTLPTPCYVYDLAELRTRHQALRRSLPQPTDLLYAVKANPHPDVVATLLGQGCGAEISSPGELDVALRAGADPATFLYNGPAKRREDIDRALRAGVRHFSVDSAHGVRQLAEAARAHQTVIRYLLRVNPERVKAVAGLTMTGVPSQFGADEAAITAEPDAFTRYPHAVLDGLQLYLATNLPDTEALMAQFRVALAIAVRLQDLLKVPFGTLDLGGGFAAPYAVAGEPAENKGLAEALSAELDTTFAGWRQGQPRVAFESGRGLAATCGRLLTRVLDVKRTHGKRIVVLDSGIHHLGGMAGLRRVPPLRPDVVRAAGRGPYLGAESSGAEPARICGPLCTPLDTWAGEHPIGELAEGDLLAVPNVGAYGLTASLALFLSHPLPVEITVDGGRIVGATRLSTRRDEISLSTPTSAADHAALSMR
ncbi:alanine racemase [Streptomyces noursei]|uniref:alanine racemase n=1 Tax=Streptomyces noursei TaxID=1971 RepID=UPI0006E20A67